MTELGTHIESLLSLDRQLNLIKYSNAAAKGGYIAECGVFRGGSLSLLAKYNPGIEILAFDSFEGVPEGNDLDIHQAGDFGGLDSRAIIGYFSMVFPAVRIFKGWIPKIFEAIDDHTRFSFTHIDLDMNEAVHHACDFIFPRTLEGGMILFDDYKQRTTPGATAAIDKFFEDKECKFKGELFYYEGGDSHKQFLVVK